MKKDLVRPLGRDGVARLKKIANSPPPQYAPHIQAGIDGMRKGFERGIKEAEEYMTVRRISTKGTDNQKKGKACQQLHKPCDAPIVLMKWEGGGVVKYVLRCVECGAMWFLHELMDKPSDQVRFARGRKLDEFKDYTESGDP